MLLSTVYAKTKILETTTEENKRESGQSHFYHCSCMLLDDLRENLRKTRGRYNTERVLKYRERGWRHIWERDHIPSHLETRIKRKSSSLRRWVLCLYRHEEWAYTDAWKEIKVSLKETVTHFRDILFYFMYLYTEKVYIYYMFYYYIYNARVYMQAARMKNERKRAHA